mgnify:CR=1 FL=1|jgi:hypothetical protein
MKIFFYKSIIISFLIVVIFKLTISSTIQSYEKKIYENFNKQNIELIKDKIRSEIESAIKKENYLKKNDVLLINKFFSKIRNELSNN